MSVNETRMLPRMTGGYKSAVICCIGLLVILLGSARQCQGAEIKIYPQRLNLNAKAVDKTVLAVVGVSMPSGYGLTDYQVDLWLNDVVVISAQELTYSEEYDIFYAYFDRQAVSQYCLETGLEGDVWVRVSGWFEAASDNGTYTDDFIGFDSIKVVKPGKKKSLQ